MRRKLTSLSHHLIRGHFRSGMCVQFSQRICLPLHVAWLSGGACRLEELVWRNSSKPVGGGSWKAQHSGDFGLESHTRP